MYARIRFILLALTAGLVFFVAGSASVVMEAFPYRPFVKRGIEAIEAWSERTRIDDLVADTPQWRPARTDKKGVIYHDPSKSWGDYTLYLRSPFPRAYLIDKRGEVVHEWHAPFRDIWSNHPHIPFPVPDSQVFWRRAHLFSNGDLLVNYTGLNDSPYGYGLAKLNEDSEPLWTYPDHVHHDFDVADNGTIHAIVHDFVPPPDEVPQLPEEVLTDFIVRLSSQGEERARVSLTEAIVDSPYREMIQMHSPETRNPSSGERHWDPIHANTVEAIDADFAEHHHFAEPGHLLVSLRGVDAIVLLDLESETVVWASRGFWWGQHHPVPLDNGRMVVLDNNGYGGAGGESRVVEFDPSTNQITWSYGGTPSRPFATQKRGSLQVLPNGNVLVTSSWGGRIFEVTRSKDVVWDFHNPTRKTSEGETYVNQVLSGLRFEADALTFLEETE